MQKDYSNRKTLHISYKALSSEKVLTPALVALIRSIPTLSILKASEIDSDQSSHGWGLGPKPPPTHPPSHNTIKYMTHYLLSVHCRTSSSHCCLFIFYLFATSLNIKAEESHINSLSTKGRLLNKKNKLNMGLAVM